MQLIPADGYDVGVLGFNGQCRLVVKKLSDPETIEIDGMLVSSVQEANRILFEHGFLVEK